MPVTTLSGLIAVVFYLIGTLYQAKHLNMRSKDPNAYRWVFLFGLLAVAAHLLSARGVLHHDDGYHFGIVQISTLICASISLLVLLSGLRKPLGILILGLFPLAILSIIVSLSIPSAYPPVSLGAGLASHILLSILAYSLFTIATLQAGFLAFQNHQLKHRHAASVIRRFPPLQDMESVLFELLWTAQGLLTLGILAGFFFVDDIWAHGLLHKMFFSVLAWLVFAVLLWGRHRMGWRGTTAIRFTLTGFIFLILGFYGSKAVLEYILN
ncbi:MAG: cytochrome c biogenesis protein CcsA [Gammaproteobacteria bacterium]|nr:cytochrome c biogenesis protein CcsA [Pseudomonadales bacterium]MCP5330121.1 cytochrome c biogenesis protein CcsA [Pseudomonadales bacterium]